jgi:hypothetical protein
MTAEPSADGAMVTDETNHATDLRLARLHLRTGATALARAELEWLAAAGALDTDGLSELAVARWRTADLAAAAEAAAAHLDAGGSTIGALVVAAEAAAAEERTEDAAALVGRVVAAADAATFEAVIAGRPLLAPWPPDLQQSGPDGGDPAARDPLRLAQRELDGGQLDAAALRLGLTLRRDPETAPAVLDTIGERSTPALDLVRGDALRTLGRETEAERAFASAEADLDR